MMLRVVVAGVMTAFGAWSFQAVFTDGGAFLLALLVPVAVAVGWGLLGRRAHGAAGTALAVAGVVAVVGVITRPGWDFALGPAQLLTGILPVDPAGPPLAAVSALAGFAALVAVRLALRDMLSAVLPALCCLLLGLGLGASVTPLPVWYAPVFALTTMVFLLIRRGLSSGRLVVGVAVTLVAIVIGVIAGPLVVVQRSPTSLQSLVDASVVPREQTNPMAQYLALRDGLIPLRINGAASQRTNWIRMVTLNRFDGRNWSVSADYRRAGTQLPDASPGREVTLELSVQTPTSIGWLPRAGQPVGISTPGLGFDRDTGDIVVPAGTATPSSYRVTGVEPDVGVDELQADDPVVGGAGESLPPDVSAFVDSATTGRSAGLGKFLGLYQAMTDPAFRYDTSREARGGHGLRQITKLLQEKRGTSEQYASAFAVMCRHLGFDARVVLGFRPAWEGNQLRISGGDVFAWTEVRFQRLGWIPVDTSPAQTVDQQVRPGAEEQRQSDPVSRVPPPDQVVPADEPAQPAAASPGVTDPPAFNVFWILLAVLVGCVGVIPLVKIFGRVRSRRSGSPRRRVLAAWRDALGTMRAAGLPVHPRATTSEVLDSAPAVWELLLPLAGVVDQAAFAPEPVGVHDADFAWRQTDAIRSALRRKTGLHGLFDLRSMLTARGGPYR